MSDEIVISVENLSKCYRLGEVGTGSLKNDLHHWWCRIRGIPDTRSIGQANTPQKHPEIISQKKEINGNFIDTDEQIWALKGISFAVKKGEVLGIIGKNGSGKSTLLKTISRVTAPTYGVARIKGRVASLLEVGTGFHRELTGRENIFLNGAINGLTPREIKNKFDEIVDFSEIGKFIDTPVKRYSSGMYVRLAFAVAAHLEPDILLCDEVLAVGDASFQEKCIGKMGNVARAGRTVLFVSHNMQSINALCNRTIWLDYGEVKSDGETREVVEKYLGDKERLSEEVGWALENAPGGDIARILAVRVLNNHGSATSSHDRQNPVTIEVEFRILRSVHSINCSIDIYNTSGVCLFSVGNFNEKDWNEYDHNSGFYRFMFTIPGNYLNEGDHFVSVYLNHNLKKLEAYKEKAVSFTINDYGYDRGGYTGKWSGVVRPLLPCITRRIDDRSINEGSAKRFQFKS